MDDLASAASTRCGLCVIHPGGDGAHPWVTALLSALAQRLDVHRIDAGLSKAELLLIARQYPGLSPLMPTVMAERSREAALIRRENVEAALAEIPSNARRMQIYTNDCAPAEQLDGILTDTLLATVVSMADILDGYEWDQHLLDDALGRELATLRMIPRFWVASHWQREWCVRHMPPDVSHKITVVGWGPGLSLDTVGSEEWPREPKAILFVGHDHRRKGLDVLLDAFPRVRERHPDVQLWIVGGQDESTDFGPGILHHGTLDQGIDTQRRTLLALFKRASVAVLPSRFEPFGCFLLEAMSAKLPIIAPKAFAFPEFLKHMETGLFIDGSVADLVAALEWLFSNPQAAEGMGRAGQAMQAAHFDWRVVADRIIEDLAVPC